MPHLLDIKCPRCGRLAEFEFAEVREIVRRRDIDFFQRSDLFEYRKFQKTIGQSWHGALYHQGLHGNPESSIKNLPTGYKASEWSHPKCFRDRRGEGEGAIACAQCHLRRKHLLLWPNDAYFSIHYRAHTLWAFNVDSAIELLDFLSAKERDQDRYRWRGFLTHVPTVFKTKKAREVVCRRLSRLLDGCFGER